MPFDAHRNLALSSVATPPSPPTSGVTLSVAVGQGARFPAPPFNVTIWLSTQLPDPLTAEVARVTARAGDVFTLQRAQEGTTARVIVEGDLIAETITAKALTDLESGTNFPQLFTLGTIHADGDITTAGEVGAATVTASGTITSQDLNTQQVNATDINVTHLDADTLSATTSVTSPLGQFGGLGTTPLPAANLTGTVADARLSVNVLQHPGGYPGGSTNFLRADATFAAPPTGGIPAAHHLTHETGGSDAVVALSGAVITTGTVADARLSSNVPLKNAANVFTVNQRIDSAQPAWILFDTSQPVNARRFHMGVAAQTWTVHAVTDDGTTQVGPTPISLYRTGAVDIGGAIRERQRAVPLGEWTALTPPAGWTGTYQYSLSGLTMLLILSLAHAALAAGTPSVNLTLPLVPAISVNTPCAVSQTAGVWAMGIAVFGISSPTLQIFPGSGNFTGGATSLGLSVAIAI